MITGLLGGLGALGIGALDWALTEQEKKQKKKATGAQYKSTYYTSPNSYNNATQSSRLGNDYSSIDYSNAIENQLSGYKDALNAANAGTRAIDLSGIIADYNRNNQATIDNLNKTLADNITTLKTRNEQSRNDLLTSLKRFQEANAENMKIQQQDYNSARSTLEDEAFMAQRGTVANAASRGLGGSGLQQLAQLQNRLAAGKNVSALAQKNQSVQDALRKALANEKQDTDTKLTNLNQNLERAIIDAQNDTTAKINAANTNNTNLINSLIYNEQVRQENARREANNAALALASQRAALQNQYSSGINSLRALESNLEYELKNAKNKKEAKQSLNNALTSLFSTDLGLDSNYTDLARQRINNLYNLYANYY